jgi:hypothetical protein
MYTDNTMISEVERNQKLIKIGDVLIYTDSCNSERWIVEDLFEGGLTLYSEYEGLEDFMFNEFQIGWEISEKTKKKNFLKFRFRYV